MELSTAMARSMHDMARRWAQARINSGITAMERDEFLRRHPLPWTVGNTLIWDANDKLIDVGRMEVRELLVDLVNRWGGFERKEETQWRK